MTSLLMPVVWSPDTLLHRPEGGVWVGVRIADDEPPERVDLILQTLSLYDVGVVEAAPLDRSVLEAVHDPGLIDFLETIWERWLGSGYLEEPGMDRAVAYAWPHPSSLPAARPPASISAWAGMYATDTMTLIGPGSWEAIRAAAATAYRASELVRGGLPAAYALARPPGHHAGRSFFGGSCYLNNAAFAVEGLAGMEVAVIDLDAHHGNGTQQLFWNREDVRYGSVHVDPGQGWYPHYVGFASETGGVPGSNLNLPLDPGAGDGPWLEAVDRLVGFADGAEAIVISLGVDAAEGDPESPLGISRSAFREAGRRLGSIAPAVIVQEGGYNLKTLGPLVAAFLTGYERTELE